MRPLPPFNARPLKRSNDRKLKVSIAAVEAAEPPAIRASRLMVKPPALLAKPSLKVLESR